MRFLIVIIVIIFSSCSSSRMIETNLYFGLTIPGGGVVSETEWNSFRDSYISKVFKDGFSMTSMTGAWYDTDAHKMITEPSLKVTCDYKRSKQISIQIDSLCYWYKKLFRQQAVLRVDKKVNAEFH